MLRCPNVLESKRMSTTNMDLGFHSYKPTKAVVSKVSVNLPGVEKQAGEDHGVWVKFRSEPGCFALPAMSPIRAR